MAPVVDVGQLLAALAARRPVGAVVRVPNTLPVLADGVLLEQALAALLDDALAFGAPPIELTASLTPRGWVRLEVTDRGPAAGRAAGAALALTVAAAHGGAAAVDGRDGGGTCAWLEIPTFGGPPRG